MRYQKIHFISELKGLMVDELLALPLLIQSAVLVKSGSNEAIPRRSTLFVTVAVNHARRVFHKTKAFLHGLHKRYFFSGQLTCRYDELLNVKYFPTYELNKLRVMRCDDLRGRC